VSDAWVALLAALGGALVGGVASTVGSMWAHSRQETRGHRTELFRGRIPHVISVTEYRVLANAKAEFWLLDAYLTEVNWDATWRIAVLASKRDVRKLRKIRKELDGVRVLEEELKRVAGEGGAEAMDQRHPAYQAAVEKQKPIGPAVLAKAREYEKWVRKKLG